MKLAPIVKINDIKSGDRFVTESGVIYTCKEVGMMAYPVLFTECIPVPAVTAQEDSWRFWIISLANLKKII